MDRRASRRAASPSTQHLHTHPELSFQELETAKRIAEELRKAGAEVTTDVGKLGVVGRPEERSRGRWSWSGPTWTPCPSSRRPGFPTPARSTATDKAGREVGVMHACGHDMHMTCFIGTARWLAEHKDRWSGTVVLVGQPAEEAVGGARRCSRTGSTRGSPSPTTRWRCTARTRPTGTVALHVRAGAGQLDVGRTSSSAARGATARGRTSTVDPIVLAALAILDLQTIVSREIEPLEPAVVTVGSIHGGTKHNIIPDEVKLQLTLRSFSEAVRRQLIEGIRRRVEGLAQAHRAPSRASRSRRRPRRRSTRRPGRRGRAGLERGDRRRRTCSRGQPVMGAEDFGLFGRTGCRSACSGWVRSPREIAEAKAKGASLPGAAFVEVLPRPGPSIETGIRAMTAAVIKLLPPKR